MSPHVNNFVTDLVQMAKAMEELPGIQHELEVANGRITTLEESLQSRELRIIDLKTEVEEKNSTIRSLEVARDDAELRFLEADDQMGKVAKAFQVALEAMDHADKVITTAEEVLHPIAPEPTPIAPPSPTVDTGQSSGQKARDWAKEIGEDVAYNYPNNETPMGQPIAGNGNSDPQGQSESHPTAMDTATPSHDVPIQSAATSGDASTMNQNDRPYANRRYIDVPGFVSRSDWLAGGGTEANYDWRPGDDTRYLP